MGGIGLRQQRQALELEQLGAEHYNNSLHFSADAKGICYDVPQDDVYVNNTALIFTNTLPGITPVCE